jgi:hypothetical protein
MRNLKQLSAGVLLMAAILVGCGQINGNNPVGVTGGGDDGYGWTGTSSLDRLDPRLFGSWMHRVSSDAFQEYVFYSDGDCDLWNFANGEGLVTHGTYKAFANRIAISLTESVEGFYAVSGEMLMLNLSGVSTTWTRVHYP